MDETIPLYIDKATKIVASPDAPTTLAGYGITDGGLPVSSNENYFLVGNSSGGWEQKTPSDAQQSIGVKNSFGGGQVGLNSTSSTGGAVGKDSFSTRGGAAGNGSATGDGAAVGKDAFSSSGAATGQSSFTTTGGAAGNEAVSFAGGAVGQKAEATTGGAVGFEAASTTGGAVGDGATSISGGSVGQKAESTSGGAIGDSTFSTTGGAVGDRANSTTGGAIGNRAVATTGGAIGEDAIANVDGAVQLGDGTNSTADTIQFRDSGPVTPAQFGKLAVRMGGFIDYNDDSGPISLSAGVWTDVPNDGAGAFSNTGYLPDGVTSILDTSTGYLDFSQLSLGSEILIRNDFRVNPQTNNSLLEARYLLGTGAGEYQLLFWSERLDSGSGIDYQRVTNFPIYMGDLNTRDNPGRLQVRLSTSGTLTNAGSYISIRLY